MDQPKSFTGPAWALFAAFIFSINDMLVKFLADDYALHQVVFTRSIVSLLILLVVVVPLAGGYKQLRTKRLKLHMVRALFVVAANLFFFTALADLPLATVVSIFFVAPFLITIFSVIFLGEVVGAWRWIAILVGLTGVLFVVRPGTEEFNITVILPILAAICYAAFHILTRKLGPDENLLTLTFYTPVAMLIVSTIIGLSVGHGNFSGSGYRSLEFLVRPWQWPTGIDFGIMAFIGIGITVAGAAIAQAYRVAEAALVAPFEYTALIYAAILGYLLFAVWPDIFGWIGMSLVLGSGLVIVWRETVNTHPRVVSLNSPP
jgi:drug/metabolite transporter (DMT)-like permease